jgi:hypothetical protein
VSLLFEKALAVLSAVFSINNSADNSYPAIISNEIFHSRIVTDILKVDAKIPVA